MGSLLTQHGFSAGEVVPGLSTRNPRYPIGLRTCKNFLPIVHGALVNRAGGLDLDALASASVRFREFIFSDTQALMLEFTPGLVRFWTPAGQVIAGGVPYAIATPYLAADLPYLKFAQAGDVVTITRSGYAPRRLSRFSNTNWTLTTESTIPQAFYGIRKPYIAFASGVGAAVAAPTYDAGVTYAYGDLVLYQPGGGANPVKMYFSHADGNVGLTPDTNPLQWSDQTYAGATPYAKGDYVWQSTNATDGQIYISLFDRNLGNTPVAASTFWAVATDTTRVPRTRQLVITQFWKDANGVERETLPSAPTQALKIATATDRPAKITWEGDAGGPASSSVTGYGVYAGENGLFGVIGIVDPPTDPAALRVFVWDGTAPNFGTQPPAGTDPFLNGDGTHSYPACVAFDNGQRRVYARSDKKPSTWWGSAIANIDQFDRPFPVQDADSYEWKLASLQLEDIRSVRTFGQLCFFAGQGEWSAQGADGRGITANNVQARKHSSHGSGWLDPIEAENALLFVTARGNYVRDFFFDYNANAFVGIDLTEFARHLFRGRTIVSWAFQRVPYHVLWVAFDDGELVSLTYDRATQMVAWAQHPMSGVQVKQVACIPNGTEDALMLGVICNGNARMWRMASRDYIPEARLACFLDGARQFDGRNTGATTMKVTGSSFDAGDIVTIDASVAAFAGTDVDDQVVVDPDGTPEMLDDDGEVVTEAIGPMRITVTQYNSATQVLGRLEVPLNPAYRNAPTTRWGWARDTLTGLDHLEGLSVAVLADSAVQGPFVVAGGQIGPLAPPACIATAGLSYNSDAELLDVASDAVKTNVKSVNNVTFDVVASRGISAGEDFDHLDEAKLRTVEDDYDPTEPITDQVPVLISSSWNKGGRACIRQSDPLPLTITAVTRDVEVGGRG